MKYKIKWNNLKFIKQYYLRIKILITPFLIHPFNCFWEDFSSSLLPLRLKLSKFDYLSSVFIFRFNWLFSSFIVYRLFHVVFSYESTYKGNELPIHEILQSMGRICVIMSYREVRYSMKVISSAFYLVEYRCIRNTAVKDAV